MRRICLAALVAGTLAGSAWAQNEITLNLKDADINTLIATVSDVTGRNFIIDPRVKAKVTVISSSPMSPGSLYETFLAVLQVHGFAAIPSGDTIKIVPETNARQDGGGPAAGVPPDEVVTRVMTVENVPAAQLVPILRPLVPQWGHLAAYTPSNMIIIADRAANIGRISRIISEIDRSGDQEIEMLRLEHAAAAEVVRILTTLAQQNKQQDPTTQPASIIADERSNSVLVGGDKSERQKFIEIIRSLDIELPTDGDTQVIYLSYASADNLAPILEGYAEQADQAQSAAQGGGAAAGGRSSIGSRIIADPDTNALVVTANPKTMRQIRSVVAQLDIQRAQVMVESIIAEVSANKTSQLGLDWAVYRPDRIAAAGIYSPTTQGALGNAAQAASQGADPEDLAGAAISLLGEGATAFIGRINDNGTSFGAVLHALQGDGDTNILSAPTLLTMDNEEAEISVGQEVPFLTGQYSSTGASSVNTVNPFQTVERKDVGLTLGVTPQINEGDTVKLKLNLEISSLSAAGAALTQITNKRTITNTVAVQSGQMLILGGLIDDSVSDSQSGVPFLSKIPLLGGLFRYRSVDKTKRNLMVFLRPVILRKRLDADYYTARKYNSVRDAQLGAGKGAVPLVGGTRPALKPLDQYLLENAPPAAPAGPAAKSGEQQPPGSVEGE